MKQVLLYSPCVKDISAQAKPVRKSRQISKNVIVIALNGQVSYPVFFEADEGSDIGHRSSVDLDDMTDEAFRNWLRQQN
ncbi:MAG: hypothetical protein J6N45_00120 [Alphaproteobacteria bacterium]|nr:hypothetical protein [Alphaproteobacteria bacterium]